MRKIKTYLGCAQLARAQHLRALKALKNEQAYFKRADTLLELNQFDSPKERDLFLTSVYREVNGKELKIVNS